MFAKLNPETLVEDENGVWYKIDERASGGRDIILVSLEYRENRRVDETHVEVTKYLFNAVTFEYDEVSKETIENPLPQPEPTPEQQIAELKQKLADNEALMEQKDRENKIALFEIYSLLMDGDPA
ncbi:hypothetical protein [Gorillibacterium sp. CAU 1737]|uniref:hypothetical protein n=1 Tax=Gorillibacterium sp. CAU 1737 TaxID=3140362 RepID=UPI00326161A9